MDSLASRRSVSQIAVLIVLGAVLFFALVAGQARSLILIGLSGAVLLAMTLRRPGLALPMTALLSFTLPLQIGTGSEVSLTAPVLLIPVVVIAWVSEGLRSGTLRLPATPGVLPICLLVVSGMISLIAGNAYWDPLVPRAANLTLVQLAQWAILVLSALLYLAAAELGREVLWLKRATFAFIAAGGIVATMGYIFPAPARALGWPIARLGNSGMLWCWLGAMATGQLVHNRRLRPWHSMGLVAVLAAATYVVWVRQPDWLSGWLPFTVSMVAVVWLRLWRRNRLVGVVSIIVLALVVSILFPALFQYIGGEQQIKMSWGGRQVLYKAVLDLVQDHPILGLGPASYRHYAFTRWLSLGVGRALYLRPNVSSHNNFIDMYAQFGLIGLALFLWFLVANVVVSWRAAPRFRDDFEEGYAVGVLGGLVGSVVAMMLVDWFVPFVYNTGFAGLRTSALAWMFLGGLAAIEHESRGAGADRGGGQGPGVAGIPDSPPGLKGGGSWGEH